MSLQSIIQNLDVSKIKLSTGRTTSQELVNAANLLKDCIQRRIDIATIGDVISATDLVDIHVDGLSLSVELKIGSETRASIFNETNGKFANIFWLLNDGFVVKKDWYFDYFPKKDKWVVHKARQFVERGIEDFNSMKSVPVKVKEIIKPDKYYW